MRLGRRAALLVATWWGTGFSRWAPGTVGSLATLPVHYLLQGTAMPLHAAIVVAIALLGIWVSHLAAEDLGSDDPSQVVIDEVAGTLIALGLVRDAPWAIQAFAFGAFRLLDILKPPPIRQAEEVTPTGLGIMLDDLIAGLGAGALAWGAWQAARWTLS